MLSFKKPRPQFWFFFFGALVVILGAYIMVKYLPGWSTVLAITAGYIYIMVDGWKRFTWWQRLVYFVIYLVTMASVISMLQK